MPALGISTHCSPPKFSEGGNTNFRRRDSAATHLLRSAVCGHENAEPCPHLLTDGSNPRGSIPFLWCLVLDVPRGSE
jgi:hypothetical protein